MTRDELYALGRRLYDAAYGVIVGPKRKGGTMEGTADAGAPDPRDARIAELKAQLAQAQSTDKPGDDAKEADEPEPEAAPVEVSYDDAKEADEPEPEAAPVEVSYDDAKAKVDANEELTDADVAALERGPAK